MPTTADTPKCFAEIGGKRILDWTLEALRSNGIEQIAFIGGYQIEKVRADYPELTFRHNTEWATNGVLASLFYAEDLMSQPFLCSYSDILFTPDVVRRILAHHAEMTVAVDTHWLSRYEHRSQHPSDDAEKVTVSNGRVTRIHREIPEAAAHGEYIGVAKFSTRGAERLCSHFHQARERHAGRAFRECPLFEKAYVIHLLQEMIEAGEHIAHVDTLGGYIEIDTQEDFDYARRNWK